jgi:diguanylate cyclase (GGDEF)-like protein
MLPHSVQLLLYSTSILVSGFITVYAYQKRREIPQAHELMLMAIGATLWTAGTILESLAPSSATAGLGALVAYLGATFTPPSFFLFVLRHTRQDRWLHGRRLWLVLSPTLLLTAWMALTKFDRWVIGVLINPDLPNPVYQATVLCNLFYGLLGITILTRTYLETAGPFRRSGTVLIFSASLPILTTLLTVILGIEIAPQLDEPMLAMGIATALFAWTVFRMQLLNFLPLAYPVLVYTIHDGVVLLDPDDRILLINPAAKWILGPSGDDALAVKFQVLLGLWSHQAYSSWIQGEKDIDVAITSGEQDYWYQLHTTPIEDDQRLLIGKLILIYDISDRVKAMLRMEQIANTDYLTGVHNRRHFIALAETEFSRAQRYQHPVSVIMMDIDHFKRVNDTYGHSVGDQALQAVALAINDQLRKSDILGRYGGEEFAVILPETGVIEAKHVSERIRQVVAESIVSPQIEQLRVTISIGIVCSQPNVDDNLPSLLNQADMALYRSKQNGRNTTSIWEQSAI